MTAMWKRRWSWLRRSLAALVLAGAAAWSASPAAVPMRPLTAPASRPATRPVPAPATAPAAAPAKPPAVMPLATQPAFPSARGLAAASPIKLDDLKELQERVRLVAEKVRPAIVQVSGGSGVVISPDGLVMSVAHVGGRANRQLTFTFPDGRRARGVTLGNDRTGDAGLMKITDKGPWPCVEPAPSADIKPGQWCIAMSYPVSFGRGRVPVVRLGRVLQNNPMAMVTDCVIMGGDSGGPLFDLDGRVIGISSRCDQTVQFNIHVPTERFRQNWDRLFKGEDLDPLPTGRVAFLGVGPEEEGDSAAIGMVHPGSAAEKAGLKVGDVVLKFGDKEIKQFTDLPPLVRQRKPGDKVALQVKRGEKTLTVEVTLGSMGG